MNVSCWTSVIAIEAKECSPLLPLFFSITFLTDRNIEKNIDDHDDNDDNDDEENEI